MSARIQPAPGQPARPMADALRQMIAVLQAERQAFATMDVDGLLAASTDKQGLCDTLSAANDRAIDAECEGLLVTARQLNEVNRRIRNLMAANVSARLDALTGSAGTYGSRAAALRSARMRA